MSSGDYKAQKVEKQGQTTLSRSHASKYHKAHRTILGHPRHLLDIIILSNTGQRGVGSRSRSRRVKGTEGERTIDHIMSGQWRFANVLWTIRFRWVSLHLSPVLYGSGKI